MLPIYSCVHINTLKRGSGRIYNKLLTVVNPEKELVSLFIPKASGFL